MKTVKIAIDELNAELDYEGWIQMKSKIMSWMLRGDVNWDEGNALRALIDHALTQSSAKQSKEQYNEINCSNSRSQ